MTPESGVLTGFFLFGSALICYDKTEQYSDEQIRR